MGIGIGEPADQTGAIRIGVGLGAGHHSQHLHQQDNQHIDHEGLLHGTVALLVLSQSSNEAQDSQGQLQHTDVVTQVAHDIHVAVIPGRQHMTHADEGTNHSGDDIDLLALGQEESGQYHHHQHQHTQCQSQHIGQLPLGHPEGEYVHQRLKDEQHHNQ